jgi:hypothetical protein
MDLAETIVRPSGEKEVLASVRGKLKGVARYKTGEEVGRGGSGKVVAALGFSKKGIDFDALDGEPVYLFFMLVAPSNATGIHLKILAKISRLLKDKFFRQALREAKTSEEALKLIRDENEY